MNSHGARLLSSQDGFAGSQPISIQVWPPQAAEAEAPGTPGDYSELLTPEECRKMMLGQLVSQLELGISADANAFVPSMEMLASEARDRGDSSEQEELSEPSWSPGRNRMGSTASVVSLVSLRSSGGSSSDDSDDEDPPMELPQWLAEPCLTPGKQSPRTSLPGSDSGFSDVSQAS
eukprot:CAMPEP_0197658616 /NCGR_PEP_ID=MMETSP1338-20131121/45340_1 /TAXON_ID=43686 ORGANISM="Pelagodinium beii, Strain RCC1491" /NCGR_SAMPLE_ID=MMETSP1338 /ASSEMBLY_ACC=CAM_ASM_000754 /LENGTH=175 /DNA_ID=CAMNT_0043235229 /DNA_START=29 /DNA_END=556 /DNA_ORIENTATION=+